jgi:hypothetical protein
MGSRGAAAMLRAMGLDAHHLIDRFAGRSAAGPRVPPLAGAVRRPPRRGPGSTRAAQT